MADVIQAQSKQVCPKTLIGFQAHSKYIHSVSVTCLCKASLGGTLNREYILTEMIESGTLQLFLCLQKGLAKLLDETQLWTCARAKIIVWSFLRIRIGYRTGEACMPSFENGLNGALKVEVGSIGRLPPGVGLPIVMTNKPIQRRWLQGVGDCQQLQLSDKPTPGLPHHWRRPSTLSSRRIGRIPKTLRLVPGPAFSSGCCLLQVQPLLPPHQSHIVLHLICYTGAGRKGTCSSRVLRRQSGTTPTRIYFIGEQYRTTLISGCTRHHTQISRGRYLRVSGRQARASYLNGPGPSVIQSRPAHPASVEGNGSLAFGSSRQPYRQGPERGSSLISKV